MTFYELEKMCKKRRIKKRIFFIFLIIVIVAGAYLIWNFYKSHAKKNSSVAEIKKTVPKKEIKPLKKTENIKKTEKNKSKEKEMVLTPVISLDFTDINTSKINSQNKTEPKKDTVPKPNKVSVKKVNVITTEILPSYEECIYQAKDALKNKNYSLALKWAQNANTKNKIRPEAWIITAKILYKTGKKQKALNILKLYLKYNKNKKIEQFLKELENEK